MKVSGYVTKRDVSLINDITIRLIFILISGCSVIDTETRRSIHIICEGLIISGEINRDISSSIVTR